MINNKLNNKNKKFVIKQPIFNLILEASNKSLKKLEITNKKKKKQLKYIKKIKFRKNINYIKKYEEK